MDLKAIYTHLYTDEICHLCNANKEDQERESTTRQKSHVGTSSQQFSFQKWVNPLCAKFFRGIININLYFMSLLHIDMTQVLKILPRVRPGPAYTT